MRLWIQAAEISFLWKVTDLSLKKGLFSASWGWLLLGWGVLSMSSREDRDILLALPRKSWRRWQGRESRLLCLSFLKIFMIAVWSTTPLDSVYYNNQSLNLNKSYPGCMMQWILSDKPMIWLAAYYGEQRNMGCWFHSAVQDTSAYIVNWYVRNALTILLQITKWKQR